MSERPVRLGRTIIYQSSWVSLYTDRVEFPGGRIVEKHHFLEFGWDGVAALVTNERDDVLMVRVYRYVTDSVGWEIPAGGQQPGEDIIQTAQREALEESGWETADHRLLYTYTPVNGISSHRFHIVRCRAVRDTGSFDRSEVEAVRWFGRDEARLMVRNGEIRDGFTLTGLLLFLFGEQL